MKEIELKILNINPDEVRQRLSRLGARRTMKPTLFREVFFKQSGGKQVYSFRLRKEGRRTMMNVKLRRKSRRYKAQEEHEVEVANFEAAEKVIRALGYRPFRVREKMREQFELPGVKIEIDKYPKLAPYMEIETQSEDAMDRFLEAFGATADVISRKTATEVIRASGLNPDNLVFRK